MLPLLSIPSPGQSTVEIGPLSIHFYGLTLLVAIAAAVAITGYRYTRRGGGQRVTIAGVPVAGYNGEFVITAVPNSTSFKYTNPVLGLANSGGGNVIPVADGFDKLAAYGRVGSSFRWLIDTDNDGVPNPATGIVEPLGTTAEPVAWQFRQQRR